MNFKFSQNTLAVLIVGVFVVVFLICMYNQNRQRDMCESMGNEEDEQSSSNVTTLLYIP